MRRRPGDMAGLQRFPANMLHTNMHGAKSLRPEAESGYVSSTMEAEGGAALPPRRVSAYDCKSGIAVN